ncbi:DUF3558 domain-containing protein [Streptomyces sp. NPDC057877]|uniref:DUF3558 domain-containing protein n=1 Tax=Streptomyces sp. NPDC057877 TaxID=3346269 RepID=UPI0036985C38
MQRKAYVSGVAALLAALLAGCTGGSDDGGPTDGSNPEGPGARTATAQPGRYRTLPEACGAVGENTLDSLLPGIKQLTDEEQREKAYAGEAILTYDNDRKVGCRWKVESSTATNHLYVDLERVVSYDNTVSDDSQAEQLFATLRTAADLPAPTTTSEDSTSEDGETTETGPPSPSTDSSADSTSGSSAGTSTPADATPSTTAPDLQPRVLDDLGDEAFVDDELNSAGSTAQQRTVTVAFRTSNVIVTIKYEEQAAAVGVVPDSEEMQDRARKLAAQLADSLSG